jgi:hypothetical protein
MNNLNIGFLVSAVLATTGLGVYLYTTNNDNQLENVDNVHNEYSNDDAEEDENVKYVKSNKKSATVSIQTKRRNNKSAGTRRKRL